MEVQAPHYLHCVFQQNKLLDRCMSFMDGSKLVIARSVRPSGSQRALHSRHDHAHHILYLMLGTQKSLDFTCMGSVLGHDKI